MNLKFSDSENKYTSFEYNEKENIFEIYDDSGNNIIEYRPKLNLDREYDPSNFYYKVLYNSRDDYSENCIFQVYVKKQRIGWIFPFQALLSDQHDYANDRFFLKYAYVASCLLLKSINSNNEKEVPSEGILLEDFYDCESTLLVLDNENISKVEDFQLENYTVSLYQKGYSYSGNGNIFSNIEKADKRLNLDPISEELRNTRYIHTLFAKEIPKDQEAFAKFHVCYQIIEILISVVFDVKLKKFVLELAENTDSLFDKREELGKITLEKQRVKWLLSNYVSVEFEDAETLNNQCKKMLDINGKKTGDGLAENLYSVRCLLVHSMYILDNESHELLTEINKNFIDVIMSMLLSFDTSK